MVIDKNGGCRKEVENRLRATIRSVSGGRGATADAAHPYTSGNRPRGRMLFMEV